MTWINESGPQHIVASQTPWEYDKNQKHYTCDVHGIKVIMWRTGDPEKDIWDGCSPQIPGGPEPGKQADVRRWLRKEIGRVLEKRLLDGGTL